MDDTDPVSKSLGRDPVSISGVSKSLGRDPVSIRLDTPIISIQASHFMQHMCVCVHPVMPEVCNAMQCSAVLA